MELGRKISILVFLTGGILLGLSLAHGELPNISALTSSGVITAVLTGIVTAFHHYGWRCPGLCLLTATPNLRGTWRFEKAQVISVSDSNLSHQRHLTSGYVVIQQSENKIAASVFWDGDPPSTARMTPVAVHEGKLCSTGTFLEDKGHEKTEHAYGAFITFEGKVPSQFTLRYRTDSAVTGTLKATARRLYVAEDAEDAQARLKKKLRWWNRPMFALAWV